LKMKIKRDKILKIMKNCCIFTSFSQHFVEKLKKDFKIIIPPLNREGKRYFPDGEVYVRLPTDELKGKKVFILHSGMPRPNDGLIELELILQILKENKIEPEIFFTYFPYQRQDKIFEKGETNVAENLVKKLIEFYKVKKIYVIDAHFSKKEWTKKYPLLNLSAIPHLMERAKKDFGKEILFLAPDIGSQKRFEIFGFEKKRINSFSVKLKLSQKIKKLVKGKIVALVDDLLSTGTTLIKAKKEIEKLNPKLIICIFTHCLFEEGFKKIEKEFKKIYFTNTIYHPNLSSIDISFLIKKSLK